MKEAGQQNNNIRNLIDNTLVQHLNLIISYLDNDTINNIIKALKLQKQKPKTFCQLIENRYFVQTYLNSMERSMYVSFYSDAPFQKIEYEQQYHISVHSSQVLPRFSESYASIFEKIKQQLAGYENNDQCIQSIREALTDPQIPFPKLRKDCIGAHCNSSFQFFLLDQLFKEQEDEMDEEKMYDDLEQYLKDFENENFSLNNEFSVFYQWMYGQWYKITHENYLDFLIDGNKFHNMVVIIIAVIDLIADSYSFYISSIEDQLHAFIEFNMRFNIYKNILLSFEEKFSFLFKKYSVFCQNIMNNSGKTSYGRQMTIWNIALSKWYMHVHENHESYFNMMFYLLRKINLISIKQENETVIEEDQVFIQVRNRICINQLQILQKDACFESYSSVEEFLQQNHELYNQFIKEYIEYMLDLSINQYSVHWCGHSNQKLHRPYQEFQQLFLNKFKAYVTTILDFANKVSQPALAIDKTLLSLIDQLDRQFLKPITLKKSIEYVENESISILGQQTYNKTNLSNKINEIKAYLISSDKKLQFYNKKNYLLNEIEQQHSIILQSQDFSKALKQSVSTKASRMNKSQRLNLEESLLQSKDSLIDQQF